MKKSEVKDLRSLDSSLVNSILSLNFGILSIIFAILLPIGIILGTIGLLFGYRDKEGKSNSVTSWGKGLSGLGILISLAIAIWVLPKLGEASYAIP